MRRTGRTGTPWFHESAGPAFWNEWTWTHAAWGAVSTWLIRDDLAALAVHTFYELVEGRIFPDPHRDVSMINHLGDTLAFLAGRVAVRLGKGRPAGGW